MVAIGNTDWSIAGHPTWEHESGECQPVYEENDGVASTKKLCWEALGIFALKRFKAHETLGSPNEKDTLCKSQLASFVAEGWSITDLTTYQLVNTCSNGSRRLSTVKDEKPIIKIQKMKKA